MARPVAATGMGLPERMGDGPIYNTSAGAVFSSRSGPTSLGAHDSEAEASGNCVSRLERV